MARIKKEVSESGIPGMNAFLVPQCILQIATKLTKNEIICLLNLLNGSAMDKESLDSLQNLGMIDEDFQIVWQPFDTSIKLVRQTKQNYDGIAKGNSLTSAEAQDFLTDNLKTLLGYYKGWLKEKNIPIGDGHILNWITRMTNLSNQPLFDYAVNRALESKIGSDKWIEKVMINESKKQSSKDEGAGW